MIHCWSVLWCCRLLVQDLSHESLLSTEAVLEGHATERQFRHRRCPAEETPCMLIRFALLVTASLCWFSTDLPFRSLSDWIVKTHRATLRCQSSLLTDNCCASSQMKPIPLRSCCMVSVQFFLFDFPVLIHLIQLVLVVCHHPCVRLTGAIQVLGSSDLHATVCHWNIRTEGLKAVQSQVVSWLVCWPRPRND